MTKYDPSVSVINAKISSHSVTRYTHPETRARFLSLGISSSPDESPESWRFLAANALIVAFGRSCSAG